MKSDNPVFQIASLLLMLGPIILFWFIDWYWIVGYYNLFFSYTCYVLYKQYDNDENYKRKFHFIIYVGLPLIFSFIGLLISVINGFEEIKEGDKEFNKNQSTKKESVSVKNESDLLNAICEHSIVSNISGFSINKTLKEVVSCFPEEYLKNDNSMRTLNIDVIIKELNENGDYDGDEYYFHSYKGDISLEDNLHGQISLHVLNNLYNEEFLWMESSYFSIKGRRFVENEISSINDKTENIILKVRIDNIKNLESWELLTKEDKEFISTNKDKMISDGDSQEFIMKKTDFSIDEWGWWKGRFQIQYENNDIELVVESNKEFKSAMNNIDVENLDSFNVDIILSKWSTYEEVTYEGDFEGYGYKLTGGIANKWTKHLGCYSNNLEGFLSDVGDNELFLLDSKLKYDSSDFEEEPDYTFIEKIDWIEDTPKKIKKEVEEKYSLNDYEKLISKTKPNETYGEIELFNKEQSNLFQIIVKYEQGGVEKSIIWSDIEHEQGKCRDCKCEVKYHLRFCESCESKRIKTLNKLDKTLAFLDKISPDKDDNASSNKNKVESKNDVELKQNINKPEAPKGIVKEVNLDFQDVRKLIVQLKENKTPIIFRSIWENQFYYQLRDESQKAFASESDHWDILDKHLETYGLKKDYDKSKKLHYSYITYIEEIEINYDQFIEESAIQEYIEACEKNNKDEYNGWVLFDYSYDDYLSWIVEEDFFNDSAAPGWLNSDKSDLIAPLNKNDKEIKTEFNLNYKSFEDVIDFNFSEVNFKTQNHLYVFDNKLIANNSPKN